jgi:hypothetical protein
MKMSEPSDDDGFKAFSYWMSEPSDDELTGVRP